jgi:hypothetical protein
MSYEKPSRRNLILGAAALAALPATTLLTPQAVIAADAAAGPGKAHRGPAHDWLGAFVAKKMREDANR